jgi:SAM-dependent methyltransferase
VRSAPTADKSSHAAPGSPLARGYARPIARTPVPRDDTWYAGRTYASPYAIVRWPHRQRFRHARRLALARQPRSLLDYGTGDGEFLVELLTEHERPPERVVALEQVDDYARLLEIRLRESSLRDRVEVCRDPAELAGDSFDSITCLGVLEHMSLRERERIYEFLGDRLAGGGRCVIDVPVEIGPSLLVKEAVRGARKGGLTERSMRELAKAAIGFRVIDPTRFDRRDEPWINDHKGFDYRVFADELDRRFDVVDRVSSPLPALPPWCFNQEVLYVAIPRAPDRVTA